MPPESYIVSIYRRERESNTVVGMIEKVGSSEEKQAFRTWEGLLALLRAERTRDLRTTRPLKSPRS
jgi:hypothetical protein